MSESDNVQFIFIEEAKDCLNIILDQMTAWSENLNRYELLREILAQLHTVKGGARLIQQEFIATVAHQLEDVFKTIQDKQIVVNATLYGKILFALDYVLSLIEDLENKSESLQNIDIIESIQKDINNLKTFEHDILDVFIQESDEILHKFREELLLWREDPEDQQYYQSAHRALHTLKGGARLCGLFELGDFTHALEEIVLEHQSMLIQEKDVYFDFLESTLDEMDKYFQSVKNGDLLVKIDFKLLSEFKKEPKLDASVNKKLHSKFENNVPAKSLKDTVRLDVGVLEKISNLAISANISSTHVSQQLSIIRNMIIDCGIALSALLEQIKDLSYKTQGKTSAVLNQKRYDFDVLEFDAYSIFEKTIHHLTEVLHNLMMHQETLVKTIYACEGWVDEQQKSTRSMEDTLIRLRLVPFEKLKPRFDRIVRQVSSELNKKVELEYSRVEGELDRNILEKIMSSIEHLIRNAIDHGIEDPDARVKQNKNKVGKILLSLVRKGSEILIEMSDDGQGLDLEKVYQIAIKKGIIPIGAKLSDREITNLVMMPGFSTRENVTQISGRGIGLDVVNSEIKKLGGVFYISTEKNKGSKFTLRLPFTLSLNKALIFSLNEITYALPLSSLIAVVRIEWRDLNSKISRNDINIEYAGQLFALVAPAEIFGKKSIMKLESEQVPLLLIGYEQGVALAVDKLIDSREIVIKSAGPQLKTVPVIAGATLLNDGTIALVLDPQVLMQQVHKQNNLSIPTEEKNDKLVTVMVVDDSLTVRKVTESLLKRHHYNVVTAIDGLDALNKMNQSMPSLILLDIEMPNMDGFELLQVMRKDKNLKGIPVIIITSRTGGKHKQKAFDFGADLYLSKPFNENELIYSMMQVINKHE